MWMNHEGYGMGGYWLGWVGMAFFGLIMILLVWALVKYLKGDRRLNAPDGEKKPDALTVLEERMPGEKSIARSTCRNAMI